MGLLTNNKLLTETENIAPKKKPEQPAKQERSAAEKSRNDKRYRARFTPVKKKENAQKAVLKPVQERSDRAERAERQERSERPERSRRDNGQRTSQKKQPREVRYAPVKFTALGGLNEIGKNLYVYECCNDMFIVDCGLAFPDEDMPGVDLVVPDFTYLEKNKDRFRGIVITHGHEDHIGALPYLLKKVNVPIYGTRLTLGLVEGKLKEHNLLSQASLNVVEPRQNVRMGCMSVEFIRVNHSIPDACALAIHTPAGVIVHTGDFKLDLTPIDGDMMNITRLGELGRDGVLMLMCESTNAERPGHTPSEKKVGKSLEMIFTMNPEKRIVIATFSSNVHRVQQIIDISARHGRKVAVTGRSMINIVAAAVELGYMKVPAGVLIDISEIRQYRPDQLTLITTGSQGEPMSALYRMAFGDHNQVTLGPSDLVVLSASAIPGNENTVSRVINELFSKGVEVIYDRADMLHVSGHACQEELKIIHGLLKPRFFIPVHGEQRHLQAHSRLAQTMGMDPKNIFISDIGKVLELTKATCKWGGTVPSGRILVDGTGVGDVGSVVLRDRKHLAQDGMLVVVVNISSEDGSVITGPDIITRGFVYVKESENLMEELRVIAAHAIDRCSQNGRSDWSVLKANIKNDLSGYLFKTTKRNPMILPVIMEI